MQTQKQLIPELALSCKGILSFNNLNRNFSDTDGVSTTKNDKIIIEEKFRWSDYEKDTYFIRQAEIDFDVRPSILLCTRNSKNIKYQTDKIIPLNQSKVLWSYDNTHGEFNDWIKQNYQQLDLEKLYGCSINTFIEIWENYIASK